MIDKKWIKVTSLALGFPGTLFFSSIILYQLSEKQIISPLIAIIIFTLVVFNFLFIVIWIALKNRK